MNEDDTKKLNELIGRFLSSEIPKEDLIAHINGPSLQNKLDGIYDNVFRPFFKYDQSFIEGERPTEMEHSVVDAVWEKLSEYLGEN